MKSQSSPVYRIENRRTFADSSYAIASERSTLSYLGLGLSTGVSVRLMPRLTVAGTFRTDGHLDIDRDTTRIARTDLPTSFGVGANPYSVVIGDVNGDTRPDLVGTNSGSNSVSVLLGNGDAASRRALRQGLAPVPLD